MWVILYINAGLWLWMYFGSTFREYVCTVLHYSGLISWTRSFPRFASPRLCLTVCLHLYVSFVSFVFTCFVSCFCVVHCIIKHHLALASSLILIFVTQIQNFKVNKWNPKQNKIKVFRKVFFWNIWLSLTYSMCNSLSCVNWVGTFHCKYVLDLGNTEG